VCVFKLMVLIMKKKLFGLAALLVSGTSFSQTIFSENFDGGTSLPAGWAMYNVDGLTVDASLSSLNYGSNAWVFVMYDGSAAIGNVAVSASKYTPAGTANDWLVTPGISLPASGTILAQFDATAIDPANPDGFNVYVSTTGNTVADFGAPALTVNAAPVQSFTNYLIDLSAYAGQTVYIAIQNNSTDKYLLAVNNFLVRTAATNDAILQNATLARYSPLSTNNTLALSVKNDGNNAITSLTINWNDGSDHSATVSCNIAPGATATVNHPTAVSYGTIVEKNIAISIDQVNAAADPNMGNNSTSKLFNTISQSAQKKVVIEEGTGTWCGWCPRGAVAMEYMTTAHPDDFIGIAVHNGDPMAVTEYNNGANFTSFPGANVDRAILGGTVSNPDFDTYYADRIALAVPASITATSSGSGSALTVDVSCTFHTVFAVADYRLAVVLTEDDVTGTGSAWDQHNYYSSQTANIPLDGAGHNWQNETDPVPAANMEYDHVGRVLLGGYTGQVGSVPATITDGQTATYSFNYTIPSVMNRAKMHAVALLLDNATGEIVNADEISIATVGLAEAETETMNVYPNPATTEATVSFDGKGGDYEVNITDMAGRVYVTQTIADASGAQTVKLETSGLKAGTYMVTVANATGSFTQNLVIK